MLAGCSTTNGSLLHFVATDRSFKGTPRAVPAKVLVDEKEMRAEPPFKIVGVLEIGGKETESLDRFVERAGLAGGATGCDVIVQRDAFGLGTRVQREMPIAKPGGGIGYGLLGRDWHPNDEVVWQFLCGVIPASEAEQSQSMKRAVATAVELRRKALGNFEPCEPYFPSGSHIRRTRVCADDPQHHSQADGRSAVPSR